MANNTMGPEREVTLSQTTLEFALPDDFGKGWDYWNQILYGASHAWAGTYDRAETSNFAHEELGRVQGLGGMSLYVGSSCSARFEVESISAATEIQRRLQAVVDAFPSREEKGTNVRGSHYWDSVVTEYDSEGEEVLRMPLLSYLARHVPLAKESHPALSGEDVESLLADLEGHTQESSLRESPRAAA